MAVKTNVKFIGARTPDVEWELYITESGSLLHNEGCGFRSVSAHPVIQDVLVDSDGFKFQMVKEK